MRVSVNLSPEALKLADEAAAALCLSRSSFIALAITEKVRNDALLRSLPQMVNEMQALQNMFSESDDSKE